MAILYIIATPIGNLEDVSKRALRILSEVDLILCEDTRNTKRLLDSYAIKKQTISYHQHSKLKKTDYLVDLLKRGKNLALVSDAGTPGISDPGNLLIEEIVRKLGDEVKIVPVPGASALTALVSVSGLPTDRFLFLGFPPVKKKRKKFFEEVVSAKYPVIFFESPYRILKTLQELKETGKTLKVVVGRELTKKFETIYRGNVEQVIKDIQSGEIKGEFVIIVNRDEK